MFPSATLTWPDGTTMVLSRSGDRVQAVLTPGPGIINFPGPPLELPDNFDPLGDGTAALQQNNRNAQIYISERADRPSTIIAQRIGVENPTGEYKFAWLADPVPGGRSMLDRLREYVAPGAHHGVIDEAYLCECLMEAFNLVESMCGDHPVPNTIRDRAILECGSELFHRRQAPNGIAQFATADGAPTVRVARDPMVAARPILAPYLPLGFA